MKFSYAVKKFFKSKNFYVLLILLALTVVIISASYAMFTTTVESKGSLNIVTGKLYTKMTATGLDSDNEIVLEPAETKTVTIKLKNVNPIAAKYNLYYSLSKENANIEIGYTSADIAPVQEGFVIASGEEKTINVKITNNEETDNITVSFGTKVGLQNKELQFPVNKLVLEGLSPIVAAYTYIQPTNIAIEGSGVNAVVTSYDGCITGEEEQCVKTTCYENKTAGACPAGTIIKYKVNKTETKYFHVLHDDGEKITMQQRENTIDSTAWANGSNNNVGPITVLPVLEQATSGWTNVNDITYTAGTTTLYQNAYTGCTGSSSSLSCTTKLYTLPERTAKARMITVQESTALGCRYSTQLTCPRWMYNYLYDSISYGTVINRNADSNGKTIYGYWTMAASTNASNRAWVVHNNGSHNYYPINSDKYAARAVVEINK